MTNEWNIPNKKDDSEQGVPIRVHFFKIKPKNSTFSCTHSMPILEGKKIYISLFTSIESNGKVGTIVMTRPVSIIRSRLALKPKRVRSTFLFKMIDSIVENLVANRTRTDQFELH